jgi:hypothetical protein
MQNQNDSFSQRLFRFLVRLLPFDFRINYQGEMEGVFRAQQREVAERGGFWDVLKLWKETIVGIFTTAPREHWEILVNDCAYALRMMRKSSHRHRHPYPRSWHRREYRHFQRRPCGTFAPASVPRRPSVDLSPPATK